MNPSSCIDLLRQMVSIPSESQNEEIFARFLLDFLKTELGMEVHLQHVEGKSYNVIGRWCCPGGTGRKLILGGHIDTVPPTPHWETDPYTLIRQGDELHGLGAADMKGGLAAQLTVLKRLQQERFSLNADVEFVGLADEERHSIGAHAYTSLLKGQPSQYTDTFFIMGEPHYDNIVIGATGKALFTLQVQGKEGHAATPEKGINAIDCMAALLDELQKEYTPRYERGECASYCCLKISCSYVGYSLTIPGTCDCLINKQLFPDETLEGFIGAVKDLYCRKIGRGTLTIRRELPSYPAYQLSPEQYNLKSLTKFLFNRFERTPELRINQSVSDGNILYNELNVPTVLFGPYGVGFHTEREFVTVSSLASYMDELYCYIRSEYAERNSQ